MRNDRHANQMERLLEEERLALTSGRLDRLEPLIKRKEALIEVMAVSPPSRFRLDALKPMVLRNQTLARAAQNGIEAVRRRIDTVIHGAPAGTYGADGTRSDIATPKRTLAKRA